MNNLVLFNKIKFYVVTKSESFFVKHFMNALLFLIESSNYFFNGVSRKDIII